MTPLADSYPQPVQPLAGRIPARLPLGPPYPGLPTPSFLGENVMQAAAGVAARGRRKQAPGPFEQAPLTFGPQERPEQLPTGVGVFAELTEELAPGLGGRAHTATPRDRREEGGGDVAVADPADQARKPPEPARHLPRLGVRVGRQQSTPDREAAREPSEVAVQVVDLPGGERDMLEGALDLPIERPEDSDELAAQPARTGRGGRRPGSLRHRTSDRAALVMASVSGDGLPRP